MDWLALDWRTALGPIWGNVLLTVAAIVCGAVAGSERERKEKSAGLRTMALVTLGSATFTAISGHYGQGDRIASSVVTGVGFLGGGTILRRTSEVHNLTTAATVWMMSAVGMVIGTGRGWAGFGLTVVIVAFVAFMPAVESRFVARCGLARAVVCFHPNNGKTSAILDTLIDASRAPPPPRSYELVDDKLMRLVFEYCTVHHDHREVIARMAAMPEVLSLERHPL